MLLRVKIISPIKIDEADLRRRRMRYSSHAGPDTNIEVFNLPEGPTSLSTPGDILFCEHAVFQEGMRTDKNDFDAILIDCVFDPAVSALKEQAPMSVFGPMQVTLPLVLLVADKFSFVARAERQTLWLADLARRYGYGGSMASARFLGISYQESRKPKIFDQAMKKQLSKVVSEDGAQAVVMGSTTMVLEDDVVAAAGAAPLFLPGMIALRVIEGLWGDGMLKR